jgi:hypothetical protein
MIKYLRQGDRISSVFAIISLLDHYFNSQGFIIIILANQWIFVGNCCNSRIRNCRWKSPCSGCIYLSVDSCSTSLVPILVDLSSKIDCNNKHRFNCKFLGENHWESNCNYTPAPNNLSPYIS